MIRLKQFNGYFLLIFWQNVFTFIYYLNVKRIDKYFNIMVLRYINLALKDLKNYIFKKFYFF